MFRLIIWFTIGVMICSSSCQSTEKREVATHTSSTFGKSVENIASPLAAVRSLVTRNLKSTPSRRPTRRPTRPYYEFHLLEEPPPAGVQGLFGTWFATSSEDDSSTKKPDKATL